MPGYRFGEEEGRYHTGERLVKVPDDLLNKQDVLEYLDIRVKEVPQDCILRIRPATQDQLSWISAPLLRERFPETMNVEVQAPREL